MTFVYNKPKRRRSLLLARAAFHVGHAWSYAQMLSMPARLWWEELEFIWRGWYAVTWRFDRYDAFDEQTAQGIIWGLYLGPLLVRRQR